MPHHENDATGSLVALVLIFLVILVVCAWNDSRPVLIAPQPATQQGR